MTWNYFKFSNVKVRVYGMLTEPGEKTTVFTIFGSNTTKHSWFTVQIDMKDVLGSMPFILLFDAIFSPPNSESLSPVSALSGLS